MGNIAFPGLTGPPFVPSTSSGFTASSFVFGATIATVQGVCVAFDSATLSDTPAWTRLDDPAGPFIVTSWSIDRGRSFELDKTQTGTASFTMIDTTGTFDPTNASSFFAGKLNPLKQVAIGLQNPVTSTWFTVFRGFISDWDYEFDLSERFLYVTVNCVDALDLLAAMEIAPAATTGDIEYLVQTVQERIQLVLDNAGWPASLREIFSGNVNVWDTIYPPRTSALSVIQDAADAEFPAVANVYCQKTGEVTFHGRFARFRPAVAEYHISTWTCGDTAAVTADSTRAPFSRIGFNRSKQTLINTALATTKGIADGDITGQLSVSASSVTTYGTRSVSFENLLTRNFNAPVNTANEETKKFANYYKDNYASPRTRINRIEFRPQAPGTPGASKLWRIMTEVDISDLVTVTTTHPGGGGFSESFYVEGVHYDAVPLNDTYPEVTLTLDVSPQAYYTTEPT